MPETKQQKNLHSQFQFFGDEITVHCQGVTTRLGSGFVISNGEIAHVLIGTKGVKDGHVDLSAVKEVTEVELKNEVRISYRDASGNIHFFPQQKTSP